LTLRYKCAQVSATPDKPARVLRYRMTSVDSPAILDIYQTLRNRALFATERVRGVRVGDELSLGGEKQVGLTFSRRTLSEAHAEVKQCLESVLAQIAEETDLLREDQLARGKLVSVTTVTARHEKEGDTVWWSVEYGPLESPAPAGQLSEYWGDITAGVDFVSDTEGYPWMPVKICEGFVPF
jgi:hypothetical protein